MQKIKAYAWPSVVAVALAVSLGLSAWNTIRPAPSPTPPAPIPAPLVEPTDENPLIVPAEITLPDRGMIRLPLKTLGTVRIVLYPGVDKVLQVEQFGADVMLARRSQVAEDVSLGLQVEHKGRVSPVVWVLVRLNLAPLPPPTPEPEPAPKPKPEPTPVPIKADGLRVLFVYESSDSQDPKSVIFSTKVRQFLNEKCVKNGKQPEWRQYDQDLKPEDLADESAIWRDAMLRSRPALGPGEQWLIVSNGKAGFEGKMPTKDPDELIAFISKFEGR